ncbi:hypothetical protein ACIGW3_31820 [Streptomyces sp. NPDC053499]|uniref:hypothetical protein n=1 Tax=Streptomyces sp. NPDC053499 TaxID=3365707 RepID=UPI0037D525DF
MSTLALLVVPLLVLVSLLLVGALGYAVYRYPVLNAPLTVAPTEGHAADRPGDRRRDRCCHCPVTRARGMPSRRRRSAAS